MTQNKESWLKSWINPTNLIALAGLILGIGTLCHQIKQKDQVVQVKMINEREKKVQSDLPQSPKSGKSPVQTISSLIPSQELKNLALASKYKSQGKYQKAEKLYKEVLEITQQKLGVDHPQTKIINKNLADLKLKIKQ